jgi:shikimate dehydrogenase
MKLSGKTKVYGLLGNPVSHSLSPLMQNHTFQEYRLDAVYVPFRVSGDDLPSAITGLRALNVSGFNVTVPHKESILPLLDRIDLSAHLIGAVNTVINQDGVLVGYNTDVSGFKRTLHEELNFTFSGKLAVVLGAGGACRAAVVALASSGVESIVVANRSLARAKELVDKLSPHFLNVRFFVTDYGNSFYIEQLSLADLVVNTTSVGLKGEDLSFLTLEGIKPSSLIYDMVYSFSETPLIKRARVLNLFSCDGLAMLAAQGEDAFALWTGVKPEAGFMKQYLMEFVQSPAEGKGSK